jgi:hypothetical protein
MEPPTLEKMQIRDWTAGTKDAKEDGSRQHQLKPQNKYN